MILSSYYYFVRFSYTLRSSNKDTYFFLHCVDSWLEREGNWYSRFHIGPFRRSSRFIIGTTLRRSLLNDLRQTSIMAIEVEGVMHEFSRIYGIYENLLDLLFQFRKRFLYSPFLKIRETITIPFLFFGPGMFYAKDILWPLRIYCRNLDILLTTISSSKIIRGHVLIQKNNIFDLIPKKGKQFQICKVKNHLFIIRSKKICVYPWISTGFPNIQIERIGFRIELITSLCKNQDRLTLEIVTNRNISPRIVLKESTLLLINKFSIIFERIFFISIRSQSFRSQVPLFSKIFLRYFKQNFHIYIYFEIRFLQFRESFRLNLINLEITKERYSELQNLGLSNIGQLMERFIYQVNTFSPILKKQRQQALFRIGVFIY